MRYSLAIFLIVFSLSLRAQVFVGSGGLIANNGTISSFNIPVAGLPNDTLKATFGLEWVQLQINHQNLSDLAIYLKAPNGLMTQISIYNGGSGTQFLNTIFNNTSTKKLEQASSPFTDTFKSEGSLAVFNSRNVLPNGTWQIMIFDAVSNINAGSLISAALKFSNQPAQIFKYTSSKLPIISINTEGQTIPTDPKIKVSFFAIDNPNGINQLADTQSMTKSKMFIEIRGNSSSGPNSPKKGFLVRVIKEDGSDSNVALLGLPKEHDFIFNNFFGDVTYTKDVMSYDMYRRIGRYASRTKYFELFINGDYRGIYCLFEKIKRDNNRVDIAKLKYTDTAGLDVTGGYIFKNDWTDPGDNVFNTPLSSKNYVFHQPDSPHAKQKAYITKFMNRLDSALIVKKNYSDTINGYRAFIDHLSFIDFIVLQELSLGGDSYIGSTYFYKDKDTLNQKLNYGPLWDFNYSWNRSFSYPKALRITTINPWREMFKDSFFVKELWCRWINLREDVYSYSSISHYLDSIPAAMSHEIYRDYERWPLSSSSPAQFYGNITNGYHYKTEVNFIKKYLVTRLSDLDSIFYKLASKYSDVCVPTIKVKFDKPAYCLGDSVVATVSGIIKDYIVSVNNKAIYYSPNLIKYKLVDNTPLQVITQVGGSFGYTYFTPKISEKPKINQFINTNLCQGDTNLVKLYGADSYMFSPSNYLAKPISGDSIYLSANQPFTGRIVAMNTYGCKDSVEINFNVFQKPSILVHGKLSYCLGDSTAINYSGASNYEWINKSAFSKFEGDSTLKVYNSQNYTYRLRGVNQGCYSNVFDIPIKVYQKPSLILKPDNRIITKGNQMILTAYGAKKYTWSPKIGLSSDTGSTVIASPSINTNYTLIAMDSNGCSHSLSFKMTVQTNSNLTYSPNESAIKIYKHADGFMKIEFIDQIEELIILNASGKILNKIGVSDRTNLTINTTLFSKGVYFIGYRINANMEYVKFMLD